MRLLALWVLAVLGGCAAGVPVRAIDPARVPVVWGGGGAMRALISLSGGQQAELAALFADSRDDASERGAVRTAVGRMERIAGEQTITWMDKSCNGNGGPTEQGQLDCVDESTNTTTYLTLFGQRGWLRFHRVLGPVWRAPHIVDTHRTAVLEVLGSGERFAVDSWYGDNGTPPIIQPLRDWKRKLPP